MVIILFGEDTFRSRMRFRVLMDAFKKKHDPSGSNISRFDSPLVSFDDVQSGFSTVGFLATKRMIIFENFFAVKLSEAQKKILEYLHERDSDDAVIIFWQSGNLPGQSGRLKITKTAKKEEFIALSGQLLTRWITKRTQELEMTLSYDASQVLYDRVGSDLWSMQSILEQLAAYTNGKREVTVEDAKLFSKSVVDENIFHLTDAIAAKQETRALELFVDQLSLGSHPLYLLTMLIKQFRLFLQLSTSSSHSPQTLGVHPYVFQKAQESVSRFSKKSLVLAYQSLESMDKEFKNGEKDALTLFTRFVKVVAH